MIGLPVRKPEYVPKAPGRVGINPPDRNFIPQPQPAQVQQGTTYTGQGGGGNKIGFLDMFLKAAAGLMRARRQSYGQSGGGGNVSGPTTNAYMARNMAGQSPTFTNSLPQQKAPRVELGQWGKIGQSGRSGRTTGGGNDGSTFESRSQGNPNTDYGSMTGAMQNAGLLPAISGQARVNAMRNSSIPSTPVEVNTYPTPFGGDVVPETTPQQPLQTEENGGQDIESVPAMIINPETGLMEPNPEYLKRKKKPIETEGDETGGE